MAKARRGQTAAVIGDRAYDTNAILADVRRLKARVVIPADGGRVKPRRHSKALYEGRDVCYLAFVHLASVLTVLRHP